MTGVLLSLSAAVGFGSSAVFARLGMQHMRSTSGALLSLVVGAVISTIIAFAVHSKEIFDLEGVAFLWFLLVGALSFPLGRVMNYTGVRLAGVSRASPIVGASPLFATVLAVVFLGESVNAPLIIGTLGVVGGLALISTQR